MNNFLNTLKAFTAPPVFEGDKEKTRIAALLNTILISLIMVLVAINMIAAIISLTSGQAPPDLFVSIVAIIIFIGLIALMRLGFVRQVSLFLSFVISGVVTLALMRSESLVTVTSMGYVIAIITAGLLSGGWSALVLALFNLLCLGGLHYTAIQGITQSQPLTQNDLTTFGGIFLLSAYLLALASRSITEALEDARQKERAQLEANQKLSSLQASLEQRVADRTRALATSTEVSRRLSTILDQNQLVGEVVQQVRDSFDYYHAHIYLFDESGGELVMAGGTGEAGQTMLARGHKIPKGKGLVGRAGETNTPILVSDTSIDPDWLPNPLLPDTKSEVAVPIAIGDRVVGVLDVQQNVVDGLKREDVDLLQSIANQVAIALQNARSFTEAQRRAERESLIFSINQKIQGANTVEDALKVTVRELGRVLGSEGTRIMLKQTFAEADIKSDTSR
jgi:putative methionine-R-sulfoxide reductase with GAF domain